MIILLLFAFPFTLPPLFLSLCNIVFLFRLRSGNEKGAFRACADIAVMLLGPLFSLAAFSLFYDYGSGPLDDWSIFARYTPVSFEHAVPVLAAALTATAGFFLLRFCRNRLPPIPLCACLSALFIGIVLSAVYSIQLAPSLPGYEGEIVFFLLLYPLNFILCSVRLVWQCVSEELGRLAPCGPEGAVVSGCKRLLTAGKTWLLAFALCFPLFALVLAVLALFGQSPDAAVRAFTHTSDWTFSAYEWPHPGFQPPPIREGSHYLCTVALRGSPAIVKPLRPGVRRGERIVVNRQLCVANAFEQYVMERAPRVHKAVRGLYDRYGYPLSKHIVTKERANAVYLLMKPLEWAFVLFLYTVDRRPEHRIASQYTGAGGSANAGRRHALRAP